MEVWRGVHSRQAPRHWPLLFFFFWFVCFCGICHEEYSTLEKQHAIGRFCFFYLVFLLDLSAVCGEVYIWLLPSWQQARLAAYLRVCLMPYACLKLSLIPALCLMPYVSCLPYALCLRCRKAWLPSYLRACKHMRLNLHS